MLLVDLVNERRDRRFVGRAATRARFAAMRDAHGPRVLHVVGPAGVGKSELVAALVRDAAKGGEAATVVDCASMGGAAFPLEALHQGFAEFFARPTPVLAVDTLEVLEPLAHAFRDDVLARVPAGTRVVLAGRRRLSALRQPGWDELVEVVELANFDADETARFLAGHDIGAPRATELFALTLGHPLTLALLVDSDAMRQGVGLGDAPDVVHTLVRRLVERVPSRVHADALVATGLARRTTESTLRALDPDPRELFAWLRELSCVTSDRDGLRPHEIARRVIVAEAMWREPERVEALRAALVERALEQVASAGRDALPHLHDVLYLIAHSPNAPYGWVDLSAPPIFAATPEDWPAIEARVREHEGAEAARYARHWLELGARAIVVRADTSSVGEVLGHAVWIDLATIDRTLAERDPGVGPVWRALYEERRVPRDRPALYARFWSGPEHHRAHPVQSLVFYHFIQVALATPSAVFVGNPFEGPEHWRAGAVHTAFTEIATLALEGLDYLVQGALLVDEPIVRWLERHFRAHLAVAHQPPPQPPSPDRAALSTAHDAHDLRDLRSTRDALRATLRILRRPTALIGNLLVAHPAVRAEVGDAGSDLDRAIALPGVLQRVARATFTGSEGTGDPLLLRVLERSYFDPDAKQQATADALGLSYSTFRRRLDEAIERLALALVQASSEA